jgi:uncharacterized MAPEG superfamily protein
MGVFLLALGYVPSVAKYRAFGVARMKNRDGLPPLTGWGARAERAQANLFENLPLFAILVIAAHLSHALNFITALGAILFAVGRTLHPLFYIAGLQPLRTTAYGVAIAGMVLILSQLF